MAVVDIGSKCRNIRLSMILCIAIAVVGPWKATFIIYLTYQDIPVGRVVGEFNDRFLTKKACREFIAERKIPETLNVPIRGVKRKATVIHHDLDCVTSDEGQGI